MWCTLVWYWTSVHGRYNAQFPQYPFPIFILSNRITAVHSFQASPLTTHWHTDTAPLFFTIILTISFICLQLLAQFVVRQPQHMQHSRRSGFVSFLPYNFLLVRYRHPTLPSKSMKQCCSSGSIVPNMQFTRLLTIWVMYAFWNWWNRPLTSLLTMWVV